MLCSVVWNRLRSVALAILLVLRGRVHQLRHLRLKFSERLTLFFDLLVALDNSSIQSFGKLFTQVMLRLHDQPLTAHSHFLNLRLTSSGDLLYGVEAHELEIAALIRHRVKMQPFL